MILPATLFRIDTTNTQQKPHDFPHMFTPNRVFSKALDSYFSMCSPRGTQKYNEKQQTKHNTKEQQWWIHQCCCIVATLSILSTRKRMLQNLDTTRIFTFRVFQICEIHAHLELLPQKRIVVKPLGILLYRFIVACMIPLGRYLQMCVNRMYLHT